MKKYFFGVVLVLSFLAQGFAKAEGYSENYWGIRFTGVVAPIVTPPLLPQVQFGQEFFDGTGSTGWRISWFSIAIADSIDVQGYYRFFLNESISTYFGVGVGALVNVNNSYPVCPADGGVCNASRPSIYVQPFVSGALGFIYEPVTGFGVYAELEPLYFIPGFGFPPTNLAMAFGVGFRWSY